MMTHWRHIIALILLVSVVLPVPHVYAHTSAILPGPETHQEDLPGCLTLTTGNNTGRVLILIQGIDSGAATNDTAWGLSDQVAVWSNFLRLFENEEGGPWGSLLDLYSDVVYFSYDRENPVRYTKADTYESVWLHHVPLLRDLLESCHQLGKRNFDIIGHSMGGVVATEYIKLYGSTGSQAGWVKHIFTLDSPVNGSTLLATGYMTYWPFTPEAFRSEAAQDMAQMHIDRETYYLQNMQALNSLRERGLSYWNLTNQDDAWVPVEDAILIPENHPEYMPTGFVLELGRIPASPDALAQLGHNQILTSDLAVALIAFQLDINYWNGLSQQALEANKTEEAQVLHAAAAMGTLPGFHEYLDEQQTPTPPPPSPAPPAVTTVTNLPTQFLTQTYLSTYGAFSFRHHPNWQVINEMADGALLVSDQSWVTWFQWQWSDPDAVGLIVSSPSAVERVFAENDIPTGDFEEMARVVIEAMALAEDVSQNLAVEFVNVDNRRFVLVYFGDREVGAELLIYIWEMGNENTPFGFAAAIAPYGKLEPFKPILLATVSTIEYAY
ncbi:MAG: alpha/beta hydrolase [Anaerolineae bacterium]|nr:alpha/beta hydrolase [Anaerolineae bacterium]